MSKFHLALVAFSLAFLACSGVSADLKLPEHDFFTSIGAGDYLVMESPRNGNASDLAVFRHEQNGRLTLQGTVDFPCSTPQQIGPYADDRPAVPTSPGSVHLICADGAWLLDLASLRWTAVETSVAADFPSRARLTILSMPASVYLIAEADSRIDFGCHFDIRYPIVRATATAPGSDVLWILVRTERRMDLLYVKFTLDGGPESAAYDLSTLRRIHGKFRCDWAN